MRGPHYRCRRRARRRVHRGRNGGLYGWRAARAVARPADDPPRGLPTSRLLRHRRRRGDGVRVGHRGLVVGGSLGHQRGHRPPLRGGLGGDGHRPRRRRAHRGHRRHPISRRGRAPHLGRSYAVPGARHPARGRHRPLPGPAVPVVPHPSDRRAHRPRGRGCRGRHRGAGPDPVLAGHRRSPDHLRAVDAGHGRRARPAGARPLPAPRHPERGLPAQGRRPGRRGPGPTRGAVGARPREPRGGHGHQGLRRRAARGRPPARAGPRSTDVEGAPGPPASHLRPVPRRRPVLRQRPADPCRRSPRGGRSGHPRRHHQLRVPLHAAGVAAADHRLRVG